MSPAAVSASPAPLTGGALVSHSRATPRAPAAITPRIGSDPARHSAGRSGGGAGAGARRPPAPSRPAAPYWARPPRSAGPRPAPQGASAPAGAGGRSAGAWGWSRQSPVPRSGQRDLAAGHRYRAGRQRAGRGSGDHAAVPDAELAAVTRAVDRAVGDLVDQAALVGAHRAERLEVPGGGLGDHDLLGGEDF